MSFEEKNFEENLELGKEGEDVVARFLQSRGWSVLQLRDIKTGELYRGPHYLNGTGMEMTSTDQFAIKSGKARLIEVKYKTRFSWHWTTRRWVTGVDQHDFDHYMAVARHSGIETWLLFLHLKKAPSAEDLAAGCPPEMPTGLFGQKIFELAEHYHHTSSNYGKGGMIYWAPGMLLQLATAEELAPFVKPNKAYPMV